MIAAHLGIADEDAINSMSFVFFESVLDELGHKLHYDAVVNFAGNSFMEKSWDLIAESNPFNLKENGQQSPSTTGGLAGFFNKSNIQIAGGTPT